MDLLNGKIRPLYYKYLAAAFGSAMISSIYGIVDMAMVGQYHGPDGSAAYATVAPLWNVIYSLGLLMGIGGSVLFSNLRGQSGGKEKTSNEYFTSALLGTIGISILMWIAIFCFGEPILQFFGASGELLVLAKQYILPISFVIPAFIFNMMLSAFIRNDGNPGLATVAVLVGGIFNVFGDWFFVFACDMGIFGAGLATAIGAVCTLLVLSTHFISKKCTIRIVWPRHLVVQQKNIGITGFSTFFIDIAMGILTVFFNRQILNLLGTDALSVYAVIINISTIVQCCAYSVGQAAQPIISINYGAGKGERIRLTLRYALYATAGFALFWTVLNLVTPTLLIQIFMKPTESVLAIAPKIIRAYSISYLLLPLNIFSTYYFQALMKPMASFTVSVGRGVFISGILIFLLPFLFGAGAIWFAMPLTELLVSVFVIIMMARYTWDLKNLSSGN